MKVKSKALRSGTWYRTLSRIERAIVDLTIRCVEKVRSRILAEKILEIISKLLRTLKKTFMSRAEEVGLEIARKLSVIAKDWGNKTCSIWSIDDGFIEFLGVNALNSQIAVMGE